MNKLIVIVLTIALMGTLLAGAAFASYRGYGLQPAQSESARAGSTRGIFIIGGGPGSRGGGGFGSGK